MRSCVRYLVLSGLLLLAGMLPAREGYAPVVSGQLIVQLTADADIAEVIWDLSKLQDTYTGMEAREELSRHMHIWLLGFDQHRIDPGQILDFAWKHPKVLSAQFNHRLEWRSVKPDDPRFADQWAHLNNGQFGIAGTDMDSDSAWMYTTGGLTPYRQEIVLTVVDDGVDLDHPDLQGNLWSNVHEIDNNNIDDDGNGYTDDVRGWNVFLNNDRAQGNSTADHGITVAGILGAKGDNCLDIAGVNWDTKIMSVVTDAVESRVIKAYDYALQTRRLYNQTNGARGAFIVATNSSFGLSSTFPSSVPLWCAMYDSMGAEGILSIGATDNVTTNVDVNGDIPSTCPSEYLIAVTNIAADNTLASAGFGPVNIDIGAHGSGALTLRQGGGTEIGAGTSQAAPQVTGAVGLLYAAPCPALELLADSQPDSAARFVKQLILNSAEAVPALAGNSVSGGKLNLHNAMLELMANCDSSQCYPVFNIRALAGTDTSLRISWDTRGPAPDSVKAWLWDSSGSYFDSILVGSGSDTLQFSNTSGCSDYQLLLRSWCAAIGSFSDTIEVVTDGCCIAPEDLEVISIGDTAVELNWEPVLAAQQYELTGSGLSQLMYFNGPGTYELNGLNACQNYRIAVRSLCAADSSGIGKTLDFRTDCSGCRDTSYCPSFSFAGETDRIHFFEVGGIRMRSGIGADGYSDFTNTSTVLGRSNAYNVTIVPELLGFNNFHHFRIWIDYDQDLAFNDTSELVFEAGPANDTVRGFFVLPSSARLGGTRMRVSMRINSPPFPCDSFTLGEVEDYCVGIVTGSGCYAPFDLQADISGDSLAILRWTHDTIGDDYLLEWRAAGNPQIHRDTLDVPSDTIGPLSPCATYAFRVAARCDTVLSLWSDWKVFNTGSCCEEPNGISFSAITDSSMEIGWQYNSAFRTDNNLRYRRIGNSNWVSLSNVGDPLYSLIGLQDCSDYEFQLQNVCGSISSSFTLSRQATTDCPNSLGPNALKAQFRIFPNPATDQVRIEAGLHGIEHIRLYDLKGRLVLESTYERVSSTALSTASLSSGTYLLQMEGNGLRQSERLVILR